MAHKNIDTKPYVFTATDAHSAYIIIGSNDVKLPKTSIRIKYTTPYPIQESTTIHIVAKWINVYRVKRTKTNKNNNNKKQNNNKNKKQKQKQQQQQKTKQQQQKTKTKTTTTTKN